MAEKVVYFTAGPVPTAGELADIAALNAVSLPQYETLVVNGAANSEYGAGRLTPCDFVAGTIPEAYDEVAEIDPDAIPNTALTATQAIVNDEDEFEVTGGIVTVTVVAGVATMEFTADP